MAPTPEQIKEFQERLAKMSPEEREKVVQQQCLFCNISEGKIESKKVYEDDKVMAVLDINPASKGHTLVVPKKHYTTIKDLPDDEAAYLFKVTKKLSETIVKTVNAQGSNIVVADGPIAGQNVPHIFIHIIPRFENDGINLTWNLDKAAQADLNENAKKIAEEASKISFVKEKIIKEEKEETIEEDSEERIP